MWSADTSMQGAGGFMDQSYNAGSNNQQSNRSNPVRGNAVVPLIIRHLLSDNIDTLNLWGTPIKLLTIVAYVRKFERVTTKVSYELVDETGSIMAHQWVEDDSASNCVTVPAGSYARVVGSPREQGDTRHIFILKIFPVDKLAEVFEHQLEVTYACLKGEELFAEQDPSSKISHMMEDTESDSLRGMNKEQVIVFKLIQSENHTDNGYERNLLRSKLPSSIREKLDTILEFLVCEGHIYTTCTDDHFKTT